jgi:hypothetical protein
MRPWLLAVLLVGGLVAILGVTAVVANSDNTGETVSASRWADDVCGSVGAWEGQLEAIGDELRESNYGAHRNDGGSGDSVERRIFVRDAIDRAIQATRDTLREGLKRAGLPDTSGGVASAAVIRAWALKTEHDLRVAKQTLRNDVDTNSQAAAALEVAVNALKQSAVNGRLAFQQAGSRDTDLANAFGGSDNCTELQKEQP